MADEKKDNFKDKTVEELMKLVQEQQEQIKQMTASNQEALKGFAKELAFNITHPEQTEQQKMLAKQQVLLRIERAREEDAMKEHKRKHCVHPARPQFPHRRYGTEWGMFNNTSVIAWHYTHYSKRTPAGGSTNSHQVAIGVCQWCGSEFKPGDPDYEEMLGLGLSTAIGTYPMNERTGIWQ